MSEMMERVAKAIHDKLYEDSPPEWNDEDWQEMRPQFMGEARAAIEAMREPTSEMVDEASGCLDVKGEVWTQDNKTIWQAMIDAALHPKDVT